LFGSANAVCQIQNQAHVRAAFKGVFDCLCGVHSVINRRSGPTPLTQVYISNVYGSKSFNILQALVPEMQLKSNKGIYPFKTAIDLLYY
jgi:hypothetical protein